MENWGSWCSDSVINSMGRRCEALWGKWWSHLKLTGLLSPQNPINAKCHVRVAFYHGRSKAHLRNTHAVQSASWYGTPGPYQDADARIISAKTCPVLQIKTDLWTIFQKNDFFVFVENVSDLWARLRTIRSKKKVLPLYLDLVYVYLLAFFTFWEALKWL